MANNKIDFDVAGAIKAGHSKQDIVNHLGEESGFDVTGARNAGYTEDQILRELMGKPEPVPQKESPGAFGMIGAGTGAMYGVGEMGIRGLGGTVVRRVANEIAKDINRMGAEQGGAGGAPPYDPRSPGAKWSDKGGWGAGTGYSVKERVDEGNRRKAAEGPIGKAKQGAVSIEGFLARKARDEAEAKLKAQGRPGGGVAGANPDQRSPLVRGALGTGHFAGRLAAPTVGLGLTGYGTAQAMNRLQEGTPIQDKIAGALNVAGATAGVGSVAKNPRIKYPATAISGGLNYLADLIGSKRDSEEPYAAGGVVGYNDGGPPKKRAAKAVVETAIGKTPKAIDDIIDRFKARTTQTVKNPLRMDYPGIYERPDIIAQRAVQNTAPESPLLKQLFGVSRGDLYEMSKRKGNMPGVIPKAAKNPKGSAAVESIMTPQNEQRILDVMSELQTRAPGMYQGMHGWYTMDPEYQRLVQLVGKDEAGRLYRQLNTFGGIESPNMPVPNEFRRASAAHMMAEQNRFPEWMKYGGIKAEDKPLIANYPSDLMSVPGRVGHARASKSQNKYIETGLHGMDSPKAPPYIEASSVPELGFQTDLLVGDAHLSRGVGLADVRTGKSTAESVSTPELQQMAPWWREKIANEMGTESVPAQAILWGGLGPYTGVKTAVGAPKLELHAIEIGNAAKRLGVSPETARDLILMGKERAGKAEGGLAHMASGGKTPAWQRKEGKNPEGGLNAKGRASYKAETGGTLKRPQPEGGARRDSFCSRMSGMKKKLTSAKTANDPDSRINKALRKWKC